MTTGRQAVGPGARQAETPGAHARAAPPAAVVALSVTCLLLAVVSAFETVLVSTVHGDPIPWVTVLEATSPRWILLAVALPIVLQVTLARPPWPFSLRGLASHLAIFVGISVAHAFVHGLAIGAATPLAGGYDLHLRAIRVWVSSTPLLVPLYAATLLTAWGIQQAREGRARALRASQLEAQLASARLAALRSQLHPHFLYNTLNGIAALVADRQHQVASRALEQLAELLHAAFREDGRELIPLSEELTLSERYLALQQLRFGKRLSYELVLDPSAATCQVPPLILQPIVENAVLHGMDDATGPMHVALSARVENGSAIVVVSHDGPPAPVDRRASSGNGVGLTNTRARLASAFGEAAVLTLRWRPEGGVEACVRIPARVRPPGAEPEPVSPLAAQTA